MLKRRLLVEWIAVLLVAWVFAILISQSSFGERLNFTILDNAISWRSQPQDDRIVIVEIDDASLAEIGQWPWPRSTHAKLIDAIAASRPTAIGYDVLFHEASTDDEDAALGRSMARSSMVVVPSFLIAPGSNGRAFDLALPIDPVRKSAAAIGHVNVVFDSDGIVRRAQMQFGEPGGTDMPHMMKAMLDVGGMRARNHPASNGTELIPYRPLGSFRTVRARDILSGETPASLIAGKFVLVGATAQGLGDILAVPGPAGSAMPGVEVQANLLSSLLTGKQISEADRYWSWAVAVAATFTAMLIFWRVQPTRAIASALVLAFVVFAVSILLLMTANFWIAPTAALLGLFLAYPLWSWRRLAALNHFVASETHTLRLSLGSPDPTSSSRGGLDAIAAAATQLKSVIGQLSGAKSFMQAIIDNAPDALSVVDHAGRVILTNDPAKAVFGHEIEGQIVQSLMDRIAPGSLAGTDEIQLWDGRYMLVKSVPFETSDQGGGSILRLADVTDRRLAEQERDQMLEFLSHDMRAPQAAIIALLDLHEAKNENALPTGKIRDNARLSLKLADDFVQLAKLSKVDPELEELNLASVVIEAADRNHLTAKAKSVTIKQEIADEGGYVFADPWILTRALNNLIDNAIKYGPEGSVVTVGIRADRETLTILISDQGPGIPTERREALFERFGPSDKRAGLSSGLGLAYVKKAADLFGAVVNCDTGNNGTTFSLIFTRLPDDC